MDLFYDTCSTILVLHLFGIIHNDNKISKPKKKKCANGIYSMLIEIGRNNSMFFEG